MEPYELTPIAVGGLPRAFILESDSIDRLLLSPGRRLLGWARQQTAFKATVAWCRALLDGGFLPIERDAAMRARQQSIERDERALVSVCTVTVLAEGIGHNLPGALASVLAPAHSRGDNWLGVSRFALPRTAADAYTPYDAVVTYVRLHSPAPVWVMLDTVATGATLVRGLQAAFATAPKPERILLGTPAGSVVGMRTIAELCAREGVELTVFFFGAAFGLWEDGTALPWCHPDTIVAGTARGERNRAFAAQLFNNLEGFCAVGDCAANFFDVAEAERLLREDEERFGWKLRER